MGSCSNHVNEVLRTLFEEKSGPLVARCREICPLCRQGRVPLYRDHPRCLISGSSPAWWHKGEICRATHVLCGYFLNPVMVDLDESVQKERARIFKLIVRECPCCEAPSNVHHPECSFSEDAPEAFDERHYMIAAILGLDMSCWLSDQAGGVD